MVWTSAAKMSDGREFCSIFGESIRTDADAAPCAVLARAMNANLVAGRGVPVKDQVFHRGPDAEGKCRSTKASVCFRGGGFRDTPEMREFFQEGKLYRAPQFVATSFQREVAQGFINRAEMGAFVNARVIEG